MRNADVNHAPGPVGLLILGCLMSVFGCRETRFWNRSAAPVAESESGEASTSSRFFSRLPYGQKEDTSVTPPIPTPVNYANIAADLVTVGNEALREQRLGDAERAFSDALSEDESCWEAHHGLAMIADLQQDWQASERHYKRALGSQRENASLLSDIGYSYILQSRYAEADDYLNRAIEIEPGLQQAHLNLALLELKRGDRTAAMNRVNTLFPNSADALQVFTDLQDKVQQGATGSPDDPMQIAPDLPAGLRQIQEIARLGREREEMQRAENSAADARITDYSRGGNAGFPEDEPPMLSSPRAHYPDDIQVAEGNNDGPESFVGPVEAPPTATPLISRENRSGSAPDSRDASVPVSSRREVQEEEEQQVNADGQVTQTGFQYYEENQDSGRGRPQFRSETERVPTGRPAMSGTQNLSGPQYRDDSRYSSGPQYRDDSRYSSGPQYRDDSRYSSGPQYRDDSRYSSGPQYRDDSRYSSGPQYRDDSRYSSGPQYRDDSRYSSGPQYRDDSRYSSGPQYRDDSRYSSGPQYRDDSRYSSGPQYREESQVSSDGRYGAESRPGGVLRPPPDARPMGYPASESRNQYVSATQFAEDRRRENGRLMGQYPPTGDVQQTQPLRPAGPTQLRQAMPVASGEGGYSEMTPAATSKPANQLTNRPQSLSAGYNNQSAVNELSRNRMSAGPAGGVREQIDAAGLNVGPGVLFPVGANGEAVDSEALNAQLLRMLANPNAQNIVDAPSAVANGTGINGAAWPEVERYVPAERASQQWTADNSHLNQGRFVNSPGERNRVPAAAVNPLNSYQRQLRSLQETYGGQPSIRDNRTSGGR